VNEIGRQLWQPLGLVFGPAIFDREILPLNKATLFEPLAKGTQKAGIGVGRGAMEEPNDRHPWLLCLRSQRPRRRAADKRDEIAPFQLIGLH
jgi:hypothetical protein